MYKFKDPKGNLCYIRLSEVETVRYLDNIPGWIIITKNGNPYDIADDEVADLLKALS